MLCSLIVGVHTYNILGIVHSMYKIHPSISVIWRVLPHPPINAMQVFDIQMSFLQKRGKSTYFNARFSKKTSVFRYINHHVS